ncbi:MAG: hypothetical protein N4A38_03685 [Candidatus Gracilibacteria bacterium]|nr:hypothetical protein [Candidatus Gracilibacteria bacterium]
MNKKLKNFLWQLLFVTFLVIGMAFCALESIKPKHYYIGDTIEIVKTNFQDPGYNIKYKNYFPDFYSEYIKSGFLENDKIYLQLRDIKDYGKYTNEDEFKGISYIIIWTKSNKFPAYYNTNFENIEFTGRFKGKDGKFIDTKVNNYELTNEDKKIFQILNKSKVTDLGNFKYRNNY